MSNDDDQYPDPSQIINSIQQTISSADDDDNSSINIDSDSRDQLLQALSVARTAQSYQSTANDLQSRASAMTDPAKREKLLQEAFDKEIAANGHSKMARRMQSGVWQGLGFGGGIGAATGLGLGAGVGTLVGAVAAVPTTGIGMLIGSGVGAIHGPWIKLKGKGDGEGENGEGGEGNGAEVKGSVGGGRQGLTGVGNGPVNANANVGGGAEQKERRKPKKLEIRSHKDAATPEKGLSAGSDPTSVTSSSAANQEAKKKPKKLEVRSGKSGSGTGSKADS